MRPEGQFGDERRLAGDLSARRIRHRQPCSASSRQRTDPGLGPGDDLPRAAQQRFLRGLFAGGTFCYQSQQILRQAGLTAYSNAPLSADMQLPDPTKSIGHTLIDMGDDEHTQGRLHPMIDGTLRAQRILDESLDPEVAILLLDFVLGTAAARDPVGDIVGAIVEGRRRRATEFCLARLGGSR